MLPVQSDLVAIINARCAHERQLEQRGQLHLALVVAAQCQQMRRVMAVQQVMFSPLLISVV